jgi:hypothetical protein
MSAGPVTRRSSGSARKCPRPPPPAAEPQSYAASPPGLGSVARPRCSHPTRIVTGSTGPTAQLAPRRPRPRARLRRYLTGRGAVAGAGHARTRNGAQVDVDVTAGSGTSPRRRAPSTLRSPRSRPVLGGDGRRSTGLVTLVRTGSRSSGPSDSTRATSRPRLWRDEVAVDPERAAVAGDPAGRQRGADP